MDNETVERYLRELYHSPELKVDFFNILSEGTYAVQFQRKKSSPLREMQHNRMNEYLKWEKIYLRKQKLKKLWKYQKKNFFIIWIWEVKE